MVQNPGLCCQFWKFTVGLIISCTYRTNLFRLCLIGICYCFVVTKRMFLEFLFSPFIPHRISADFIGQLSQKAIIYITLQYLRYIQIVESLPRFTHTLISVMYIWRRFHPSTWLSFSSPLNKMNYRNKFEDFQVWLN